jgi:glycogen synthase
VYFGRLEWEKGVHDLLAALPRLRRAHPGTRLVVAGRGVQAQALVEQARKLRVRRSVDFVGHLPDRSLVACLAAADAVVLPSRYEPFGIAALEAAAVGAPLVASTAGGLAELVIDGSTGLSVTPGDVDGIVTQVRAVLADPAAAARRAKAARARLGAEFDWTAIAEATAAVYRSASVRERPPLGRPKIATGNAFRD